MLSYQNIVNQDPTERSQPRLDWISIEEMDALLQERSMLSQTNFSKSFLPNLTSSSDRFAKCAETAPRGGVFYDPNAHQSEEHIKNEECVDLDRLLYDNSDEPANIQSVALAAIAEDIGLSNNFTTEQYRNKGVAITDTTNPFIFNKNIINSSSSSESDNIKNNSINNNNNDSNDCYNNTIKYSNNSHNNNLRSGYQSTTTSASQSPTNVFSMEASPNNSEYYMMLADTDLTSENAIDGPSFFDSLFYDNMLPKDDIFYTPDNSTGPIIFSNEVKCDNGNKEQPLLTLNLKNTFVTEEEINTPNIIDSIMEASENLLFQRDKTFKEQTPFITTLQDFTVCPPSTSSIATISDTIDTTNTTTTTEPHTVREPRRRPGRPRKRRHTSDDERGEDDGSDETYVPPTHLRRKFRESRAIPKKQIIYEDISDEETDYIPSRRKFSLGSPGSIAEEENRLNPLIIFDDEGVKIGGKRGRPPKHARSISSDDYSLLDPEEAKYREMRDRNNEASRKSRYKRKQKETLMCDELDDLETENVKLKTQVDELQKTVDRYRDNLMKVMLHKS